jgi:hypothetical protein
MTRRARATESDAPPERLAYRVDEARPGGAAPPPFSAMNSTPGHSKASNDPRPHAIAHTGQAALSNFAHRRGLNPGITGWAEVNGLRGEACTVEDIETRD